MRRRAAPVSGNVVKMLIPTTIESQATSPYVFYDRDCGFCLRVVRRTAKHFRDITFAPLQLAPLDELRVDELRARSEVPFRFVDGRVLYGHEAVAAVLATGGIAARLTGRLLTFGPMDRLSAAVYRWVATHRHRLPGGSAACAVKSDER